MLRLEGRFHAGRQDGELVAAVAPAAGSGALVSGYPAIDNRAWLKASAVFAKLPELQRRVRELERRLEELSRK